MSDSSQREEEELETYYRNAHKYINVLQEYGIKSYAWSYGEHMRERMDSIQWASMQGGPDDEWRAMIVAIEGALAYDQRSEDWLDPVAVYPVWNTSMPISALEAYCATPVTENPKIMLSKETFKGDYPGLFVPKPGQAHKVVIFAPPDIRSEVGRLQFKMMREVRDKYPDVEWIVWNTASFRIIFSGMFQGAGFDAFIKPKGHLLITPPGKVIQHSDRAVWKMWFEFMGYDFEEVWETLEGRIAYCIDSFNWASRHFERTTRFRLRVINGVDINTPDAEALDREYSEGGWFRAGAMGDRVMAPGDGILCDDCSVAPSCKVYREGAVCGVPSADGAELAKLFGSRDSDKIIDGLTEIVKIQSERVAADVNEEDARGERYMETDKRMKDLFDAGQKLAKLIDPSLNGKGTTVNVGLIGANGQPVVGTSTPQEVVGKAVRALEAAGIPRDEITNELILGVITGEDPGLLAAARPRVIEGVPSPLPDIIL